MIYLNDTIIIPTIFPDKTSQVWKLNESLLELNHAIIKWQFESEAEFMHLAQLKELLDTYKTDCWLWMPYLPYARQDKNVSNASTFALITFAGLLNMLKFSKILCDDPHSNIAKEIINNLCETYPINEVKYLFKSRKFDLVCYPDVGALKKYLNRYRLPSISASKKRDQLTGKIQLIQINGDVKGKKILIVDDICDGGATFIALAQELYNKKAKEINLFVSHGLFTKGTDILKDAGIKKIFTPEGEVK